jgi:LacI family transcriptional regulator, galactose operon repressor
MKPRVAARRITIADVARHAGVSTAAVSKVLRNAYGVSAEMSERVRSSITELGYRPHAAARGMRGRSFTIGLLLDNIRNPFYGDILDGVTDALAKTDFQVLVGSGGFGSHQQSRLADAMIDRAMDGLILVAPSMSRSQVIATAKSVPTVVVGHHDTADEYDSVVDDDITGAALVVDHLVALGHRRIAHTSATGTGQWTRRPDQVRSEGYQQAMHRHHLGGEVQIAATNYSEEGGYQAGRELLDRPGRPTAIFAGADIAAVGVLRAAYELGLHIPEDLSLAGYDNTTIASIAPINLTSVDQAGHDMGATAARLLCERMDGRTRSVLTSAAPRLIVRNTTGPPPS